MMASEEDVLGMREAGTVAAKLLSYIGQYVKPGISTGELDRMAAKWTSESGAYSAPFGYRNGAQTPFPAHICTSVNDVVCHGIPSDNTVLCDGDIINIDVTPVFNGYHGDVSRTFAVGKCNDADLRLIEVTDECLQIGIALAVEGEFLGSVGHAIERHAVSKGYSIIREFTGHGVGRKFHTQPYVRHYGVQKTGIKLRAGMIFTIEPIVCKGDPAIHFRNDWEAVLTSGHKTAQSEHTVLVGKDKAEVLTYEPPIRSAG